MAVILFFALLFFIHSYGCVSVPCAPRDYGFSSHVCVCNSSYCDSLEPVSTPSKGKALLYESNKMGKRFAKSVISFSPLRKPDVTTIAIKKLVKYQFILGFGGAFTDATGINIASLPVNQQTDLIESYFSKNGLEYTIGRVPIASTDFSAHAYSYDDVEGDLNLTHFKLADEDFKYKIPFIKLAQSMSSHELLLFGSPWSAPGWMKTNGFMNGTGSLKGQPGGKYYQTWADYFVRFLQEYQKQNITFWGLTAQNEPTDGFLSDFAFQAMGFTPQMQRDFIKMNLGPTLAKAGFGTDNIKLMIMDDQRFLLPKWADVVLHDSEAAQYVSGVAFHWYTNMISPPSLLDIVHSRYPGIFLMSTEACWDFNPFSSRKVDLGSWERGEAYGHDIIQDLLHWTIGWVDWNLALNTQGGPNWVQNFVDAPIIVNATAKEFYKQPMYYVLAHFSKLLPPGSIRIGWEVQSNTTKNSAEQLDIAAFQTPQDTIVVIILNREDTDVPLVFHDSSAGFLDIKVTARSIQSYTWLAQ